MSLPFNIFVPIPVQEKVYLKAIHKNYANGRFYVGNIDKKHTLKNLRKASAPSSPLGSA